MSKKAKRLYEFSSFRLDPVERLLLREGQPVELTAKVFDLLVLLIENPGKLLEKNYLLETLWPDSFVEEVNLSVNVSALRKALGELPSNPRYIETVPRRGYRFIAEVTKQVVSDDESFISPPVNPQAETPFSGQAGPADAESGQTDEAETRAAESDKEGSIRPLSPGQARRFRLLALALGILVIGGVGTFLLWPAGQKNRSPIFASSRSLAVLPFRTLTTGEADQALGMGMADALITRLSSLSEITVRPTSAVLKYSDSGTDALIAGRELNVEAVLDGRIQQDEKRIRVTAQLLRVSDGATLWSGKFDDFFTNVFALQDSISEKMMEALSLQPNKTEQELLSRRFTEDTEAYQLYTQGKYYYFQYQFQKAVDFYRKAVEKDPDYPQAYAGLALGYLALAVTTPDLEEMRDRALAAANKSLALDPNLDEAHNALGWIRFLGFWDWSGAEQSLRHAIELNPNNADAHINLATLLSDLGRSDESIAEAEKAFRLDPISNDVNYGYVSMLFYARRYDRALDQCRSALSAYPNDAKLHILLGRIYTAQSMFDDAISEFGKSYGLGEIQRTPFLAKAYTGRGQRAEAEAMLQVLLKGGEQKRSIYAAAVIYAALDDKEHALEWLEKAYQARENQMIHIKMTPELDNLRPDPRFQEIIRKVGLKP